MFIPKALAGRSGRYKSSTPIQTIDCSGGVLDLHFSPHRPELLACALDCGMVAVYVLRRQQQQQQQATPQSSPGVCLAHMHSLSLGQPQSLVSTPTPTVLAVAWHPQLPDVLAASLDTGTVEVLRLGRLKDGCGGDGGHAGDNDVVEDDSSAGGGGLKEQHEDSMQALHSGLNAHAFHAWTVAFAPLNTRAWWQQPQQQRGEQPPPQPFIIYSGGDDATTRASVFAAPNPSSLGEAHPGVTIRKLHQSGVTAVVPLPPPAPPQYSASPANTAATPPPPSLSSLPANAPPDAPHQLLLTGSYDEYVRIVDASAKTVLAETCLGTGVWRLKIVACFAGEGVAEPEGDYHASQSPQRPGIVVVYIVLACCLAGGARVLRIERSPADDNDQWAIRVTDEFTGHASLNYAGDVQPLRKNGRAKDRKKREAEEMKEGKDVAEVVDVEVDPLENETAATHVAGQTFRCATTGFYDKSLCIWDFSI